MTTAREICEVDGATSLRRGRVGAVSSIRTRIGNDSVGSKPDPADEVESDRQTRSDLISGRLEVKLMLDCRGCCRWG